MTLASGRGSGQPSRWRVINGHLLVNDARKSPPKAEHHDSVSALEDVTEELQILQRAQRDQVEPPSDASGSAELDYYAAELHSLRHALETERSAHSQPVEDQPR